MNIFKLLCFLSTKKLETWKCFVTSDREAFAIIDAPSQYRSVVLPIIQHSLLNLVPRVFSLFKMAAAREKTLGVSNEDGDVFKMAATARTGYETLR